MYNVLPCQLRHSTWQNFAFNNYLNCLLLRQTGARLWPAGLCIWTVPSGGVHMDLHVPVCFAGSLHPVPAVVTDSVWVFSSPKVVQFAVRLCIPALPSSGSGIPAYICGGDQQFATCILLHHYLRTGRWPARLIFLFVWSVGPHPQLCYIVPKLIYRHTKTLLFDYLIPGASNDESPLLCQGECAKNPDLG